MSEWVHPRKMAVIWERDRLTAGEVLGSICGVLTQADLIDPGWMLDASLLLLRAVEPAMFM